MEFLENFEANLRRIESEIMETEKKATELAVLISENRKKICKNFRISS